MTEGKIRAVALAIFVRPRDRAVLAVRLQDQERVFYRPPGGTIEFGEHSRDAACREVMEEIGQPVRAERLLDATHGTVEFVARSKLAGRADRLHERSLFEQVDGRWLYLRALDQAAAS